LRLQLEYRAVGARSPALGPWATLAVASAAVLGSYFGYPRDWLAAITALTAAMLARSGLWFRARWELDLVRLKVGVSSAFDLWQELQSHTLLRAELAILLGRSSSAPIATAGKTLLVELFHDQAAWQELVDSDVDATRQIVAILGTEAALARAFGDGLFDEPGLRFVPLAKQLAAQGFKLPAGRASTATAWKDELQRLAEHGLASRALASFAALDVPPVRPGRQRLVKAMFAVLETPPQTRSANRRDRVTLLEELASLVALHTSDTEWRQIVRTVLDVDELERALAAVADPGLRIRRTLTTIDRDGLGPRLTTVLDTKGISDLARLSARLWPISAPTANRGLTL
jgi:hypothetical protein